MSNEYEPISFENFHKAFKNVEATIMAYLPQVGKDEYLIGLQVGYDFVDSPNEPDTMAHTIKFGHLPASPLQSERQVEEDEWNTLVGKRFALDFVDSLHNSLQQELQQSANAPIRVGIIVNIHGARPSTDVSFAAAEDNPAPGPSAMASTCGCRRNSSSPPDSTKKSVTSNGIKCCSLPCR
jgi:hypothetical protein